MRKNRYIFIAALILAIIAVVLITNNSKSTFKEEIRAFAVDDTTNVTKVFLTDKSNRSVLLERKSKTGWTVNGSYKAQQESVDLLLKTMLNLAVLDPVPDAAHNTVISLLASSSIKVEVYQVVPRINLFNRIKLFRKEKRTKTYYVGHVAQNNIGTYMLMEDSPEPFIVYMPGFRGFVASRFRTIEEDWRDHTIFDSPIEQIESVTINFINEPNESYTVKREKGDSFSLIKLTDDTRIDGYDTLKLLNMLTSFRNIRFESFKNDLDPYMKDSILNNYPIHTITLKRKSGETNVVHTYYKPANPGEINVRGEPVLYDRDRFYALINDGNDFTLNQYFVFDKIARPLSFFREQ